MEHKMISIADQVFERLEMDILSGVYERDEILTESRLSEQLGVSRTPIREAVRRLDQEHLVDLTSKGIRVVGISRQDIADISEIRLRLEGLAARWAAERATEEDIRALREIVEHTLEPLHRKLLKYRRVSVSAKSRAQQSLAEHRAICEAIAAHDGAEAERLTIEHVKNARESILNRQVL